jgi:hypothetical protein
VVVQGKAQNPDMKVVLSQPNFKGLCVDMIDTYTATLTVREETVLFASSLLHAERQRRSGPAWWMDKLGVSVMG